MVNKILCGIIIVPAGRKREEMNSYRSLSVRRSALTKLRAMSASEDRSMCRVLELAIDDRIASYPTHIRTKVEKTIKGAMEPSEVDDVTARFKVALDEADRDGQILLSTAIDFVDSIDLEVNLDKIDLDMSEFSHFDGEEIQLDVRAIDESVILGVVEDSVTVDVDGLVPAGADCDLSDLPFMELDVTADEVINELDRGA